MLGENAKMNLISFTERLYYVLKPPDPFTANDCLMPRKYSHYDLLAEQSLPGATTFSHPVVFHRKCSGTTTIMGQLTNISQGRHALVHSNVCACLYS